MHWAHERAQACPAIVVTDVTFDTGGDVSRPGAIDSRQGVSRQRFAHRPGMGAEA